MEYYIEVVIGEYVQVVYVVLYCVQLQVVVCSDFVVLFQLFVGQVEYGDVGVCSGQYGCLLVVV